MIFRWKLPVGHVARFTRSVRSVLVAWQRVGLDEPNYDHHWVDTVPAMGPVCIVYCADHLHVPDTPHQRSRGYDHSVYVQHQAPVLHVHGN
jgi:hypothetical protein